MHALASYSIVGFGFNHVISVFLKMEFYGEMTVMEYCLGAHYIVVIYAILRQ